MNGIYLAIIQSGFNIIFNVQTEFICAIGSMSGKKMRANAVVMMCSKIMCKK